MKQTKSHYFIQKAFAELLAEYSFEELTVTQLTQTASISRNSFYSNYQDKYALLNEILLEVESYFQFLGNETITADDWAMLFEQLQQHSNLLQKFTLDENEPFMWKPLSKRIQEKYFSDSDNENKEGNNRNFILEVSCILLFDVIKCWLNSENPDITETTAINMLNNMYQNIESGELKG